MLKLYNTLTRQIEEFNPLNPQKVGIYSCGPTVYDYQHIGHMRRYVGDDLLVRVLKFNNYSVKHVMNITDVGHLVSDSDTGEDKMEKGAKKFGKSVWDIAKMFEEQFFDSMKLLDIKRPDVVIHATEAIAEQIELIKTLEKKGFTYKIADGIYFDTSKFPDYFKLSRQNPDELKKGARVDFVEGKKNVADFALWKFSYPEGSPSTSSGLAKRQMEWESPWGTGFPGWHIECSAMSMKELGHTLDIHTGGIDHINIHHTNEIAQSEAATNSQFVRYWVHHNFLMVEGEKMSKSIGNIYTVEDLVKKGYDPLALRYLYLQTHYRQEMNFTWESLEAAGKALERLRGEVGKVREVGEVREGDSDDQYEEKFRDAVNDDLNIPKALGILWELVHADGEAGTKFKMIKKMDEVLGLELEQPLAASHQPSVKIPDEVQKLVNDRENLRKEKKFAEADALRKKIQKLGYEIQDTPTGKQQLRKAA